MGSVGERLGMPGCSSHLKGTPRNLRGELGLRGEPYSHDEGVEDPVEKEGEKGEEHKDLVIFCLVCLLAGNE